MIPPAQPAPEPSAVAGAPACARCDGALVDGWLWCAWCGLHRAAPDTAVAPLTWTARIPILTSRFTLWDLGRALAATVVLTQVAAYAAQNGFISQTD